MTLDEYTNFVKSMTIYKSEYKVIYPLMGLSGEAGEAGECIEHAKKIIRDDDNKISPERREKLKYELSDVFFYLTASANDLGFSLEEIMQANVEKLTSRKERGVIKGEGDNR